MTKKTNPKTAASAAAIRAQAGDRPLGPTLTALLELPLHGDELGVDIDDAARKKLAERHGIIAIGRTKNGHFGVIASKLAETIDASPIGYADREGLDPEVAAADLASFLSVLAFAPEFFELHSHVAKYWDSVHVAAGGVLDDLHSLPNVRELKKGADLVKILAAAPKHTFAPAAGTALDIEQHAPELFHETVGKSLLLIDLESVDVDDDEVTLVIGVNASGDRMKRVLSHRAAVEPLAKFLEAVNAAFPDAKTKLEFIDVSPPRGKEADRSLALALKHAGALDLLAELGLAAPS